MTKWIQRWAGAYTFISCSFWGPQYYHALEKELGMPLDPTLFIYKKGNVTFLMTQEKLDQLGKHLVSQVKKNPEIVDKRLQEVKINYDILCRLMKKLENTIPSSNQFEEYINYLKKSYIY